jgi:hypothetical protein
MKADIPEDGLPITTFDVVLYGPHICIYEVNQNGTIRRDLFIPNTAVPKFLEDVHKITLEDVEKSREAMIREETCTKKSLS